MSNIIKIPFKQRLKAWFFYRKRLFHLSWVGAPQYQKDLEKGVYYLRKGAVFQVGQPFKIRDKATRKISTRYIENMYFNFRTNMVTHKFSDRPIKGLTEHFEARR